jgi:Ca2+-binding RTX toxin-like protein
MEIAAGSGDDVVTADFAASPDPDLWFRADLGSGNDTLLARVGFDPQPDPPAFRGEMVLSALGGAGDDRLEVEMGAAPESRLPLRLEGTIDIDLHGDAGNDRLGFRAIQPSYLPESETRIGLFGDAGDDRIDVALDDPEIEGLFELAVLGGVGDDVLDSFIIPCIRPEGRANLLFDGEAGNDRVQVLLATEDDDDTGAFDVRVLGASGDDDLTLALMGVDELSFLSALVDGGRGFDTARVTRNVRVVNCEEVIFLDEPR